MTSKPYYITRFNQSLHKIKFITNLLILNRNLHIKNFPTTKLSKSKHNAVEYCQELLINAGFDHTGTELMMNGKTGVPFEVRIFSGCVYYQRLKHMVADKFQARVDGPVDQIFKQPVKGRKAGGGLRFGEMERDSLLSHGCAASVRDRLLLSSDRTDMLVCKKCAILIEAEIDVEYYNETETRRYICTMCQDHLNIVKFEVPYILKFLIGELGMMNIGMHFKCSS